MPTLVLDTNAWLDLLVFRDPAIDGLAELCASGRIRIAGHAPALEELSRVLAYPALGLLPDAQARHRACAGSLCTMIDAATRALPRCRDPDDQIFLELAVAARADALLTRDTQLLRMHRRMQRDYGVAVLPPAAWRDAVRRQMSNR